ncbi:MAG: hypothetical protein Q7U28_16115 [Aquabacterium sp.]|nr:hypothetical protein [Aquabacterium sp.]
MKLFPAWFGPFALLAMLAWPCQASARDRVALITMLDGDAVVIHAVTKLAAATGAIVDAEDIIQTTAKTALLRLEFDDGTVIDLGPSSRLLVRPVWPLPRDKGAAAYLLEGWAKVAVGSKPAPAAVLPLATASMDVLHTAHDVVVRIQGKATEVFAGSGDALLSVRSKDGKATQTQLVHGQYLLADSKGAADSLPRPLPSFIQAVPRAFMDTLPSRAAMYKGKEVSMSPAGRLSYADAAPWLNAEPRIRARFPVTWKALAQDDAFRSSLISQLTSHPEWRRVLHPQAPTDYKQP